MVAAAVSGTALRSFLPVVRGVGARLRLAATCAAMST